MMIQRNTDTPDHQMISDKCLNEEALWNIVKDFRDFKKSDKKIKREIFEGEINKKR